MYQPTSDAGEAMYVWNAFVGSLSTLLGEIAHGLGGSYGLAVIVLAAAVRLLLLPMTLNVAEHQWRRQQRMRTLQPVLEELKQRHANDPSRYLAETRRVYREHGVSGGFGKGLLVALVQAPLGAGIYAAIRRSALGNDHFIWMRLARPDLWLTLAVAALSWAAIMLNPGLPEQVHVLLQWLPVLVTFLVVWHLSAGLGLYWAGSSAVSVLQAAMLRRRVHRHRTLPNRAPRR
ncbi:YidC/Oxa1 family membrane protein insertase [Dyella sp. A6]|uniref:YidC/Oxa1 family membrane protein insertase n=1 Tax=Dyella aluminiiresistens TaxID=3069105 RepID=UPI002E7A9810|nr:membrane protein insertase YidC [Dyella sp. A6]